jgi:hypothetical protein
MVLRPRQAQNSIKFDRNRWVNIRALQWVPMNFFPKIPEINLGRFSFRFSFGVVVAIHEK